MIIMVISRDFVKLEKYLMSGWVWEGLEGGASLGFLDDEVRAESGLGVVCGFLGSVGRIILRFFLRLRQ